MSTTLLAGFSLLHEDAQILKAYYSLAINGHERIAADQQLLSINDDRLVDA